MATTTDASVEQIRANIEHEIKALYEAKFVKEIEDFKQKLQFENDRALKEVLDDFKKSQTPPSVDEIRSLLTQEYLTFKVVVPWESETSTESERAFTVSELPQAVEKTFYKNFKEKLVQHASELGALNFDLAESPDVGKQITTLLNTFEPAFDVMADAVVMILNPRGKVKEVNREWVQSTLSSYRQWNIINAQIEVNRLRDFFSQVSRSSRGMRSNLGVPTRR